MNKELIIGAISELQSILSIVKYKSYIDVKELSEILLLKIYAYDEYIRNDNADLEAKITNVIKKEKENN